MTGDFGPDELRAALARVADLLADYFERVGDLPVLPPVSPGDLLALLPPSAPETPEPLDRIFDDYRRLIEPHTTHWNHPGFLAYFAISGSVPGIAAEALSAGLNVNGMLWRTGPALTELEERSCDWLRQLMGLPDSFRGHMNDTASVSSLLALAAARERAGLDIRQRGMAGRADLPPLTVYASEHAHSSIDKAIITLGLGIDALRKVPADAEFRMDAPALAARIAADRAAGCRPIAVVATAGTTSSTSVDPVAEIAAIAEREGLWLHVDAAYAGSAAICPELQPLFAGWERADSIVTNPHKWLFVPVDCSLLYVRDENTLRQAFSLVPEYLKTSDGEVRNLMDLGIQLGRKFRALKLWTVMRAYGAEGLRERIRAHCRLARDFAAWVHADARFERVAPVPFSTVCFRLVGGSPAGADERNQRLLDAVNARGPVLLSHTKLDGRFVLRVAIGNIRTDREHLETAWRLLREEADRL
jgi:aromatic-L-amino-acid/L-tryptophan decarboxylase